MRVHQTMLSGFLFINCLLNPVFAARLLCEDALEKAAIPRSAFYLPEDQAGQLQQALTVHGVVRLKAAGNYRGSSKIKLGSNQALYGLAATKLPEVIFPESTKNAILSGVSPEKIIFEGTAKPTQDNCLFRIRNSRIEAKNVLLENNLFVDLSNVAIDIDTSPKGYLKNNRFVRTMVHGAFPAIRMIGDITKQSQGNVFIWTNILTPYGDGIIIKNQKNVSFIGLDAESWNWSQKAVYPAMMNVFNTDFLSVLISNGGNHKNIDGQYFNLDAKNIVLEGMRIDTSQKPGIILGDRVERLLTVVTRNIGLSKSNEATEIIDIFNNSNPSITVNNQLIDPQKLADATKNAIADLLLSEKGLNNALPNPVFNQIPDPAGPKWQENLKKMPDSAGAIQALIDQKGIAELDAGIYYIGKPLLLKDGQGVIGAGADKTVIIAKSPTIDLVAGSTHFNDKTKTTAIVLADLTLQGGFNGINHSVSGSGQGADYHMMTLSHVTLRNMANAGILIDKIYAWDNNFIDHTNFFQCKTGIKQTPDRTYINKGFHNGMTFLDKNVFYQTQFVENDLAIDWQAIRANNLNAFINSRFKNNRQVIDQTNSDATFFLRSVFETASDKPLLRSNKLSYFVDSNFLNKKPGHFLFENNALCNNCRFDNSAMDSGPIVSSDCKYCYFINNTLTKPAKQPINTGLIINSNFTDDPKQPLINNLVDKRLIQPFGRHP